MIIKATGTAIINTILTVDNLPGTDSFVVGGVGNRRRRKLLMSSEMALKGLFKYYANTVT